MKFTSEPERAASVRVGDMGKLENAKIIVARSGLLLFALIPALFLLSLLLKNIVDVPYWDQWLVTQTVVKSATGQLTWGDLFAQHNESRKVFPRLLDIFLAHLTKYNVKYEIFVSYLMSLLIATSIFLLSKKTVAGSIKTLLLFLFLTNLLLFTPAQYEAWMIGLSNVVFISIFCLVFAILIAYSKLKRSLKYLIGISLAIISTYSFANGMLIWVLVLPVLIIANATEPLVKSIYRDRWLILGWIGACSTSLAIYFYNYQKPAWHPSLKQALLTPRQAFSYFLAFLGNPFAWGTAIESLTVAEWLGSVLLLLFIGFTVYLLRYWQDPVLRKNSVGWWMLGCYSILSVAIATFGRVGFGVEQSLASRYVTFALYLPIALIYLTAIVLQHLKQHPISFPTGWLKYAVTSILTTFLLFHWLTYLYSAEQMVVWRQERLQFKTCLAFINVAADDSCLKKLNGSGAKELQPIANSLNKLAWIKPPLMATNQVQKLVSPNPINPKEYGFLDKFITSKTVEDKTEYYLEGWAVLANRRKLPDAILLTYDTSNNEQVLFKVLPVKEKRQDVANSFNTPGYKYSGWSGRFLLDDIPETERVNRKPINVTVWSFDLVNQTAVPIGSRFVIN
jgi:hypothetical protein